MVAFGDSAVTVLRPTDVQDEVARRDPTASRSSGGTSLGQGLFTSLSAIAGKPLQIDESALESDGGEVDIGFYGSSAIVLLSDGENTSRPDPLQIAEVASSAGVRVHTIGLGTPAGNGRSRSTASASRPRSTRSMLTEIAEMTDGTYNLAGDAATLDADLRVDRPRARARRDAGTR